MISLNNVLLNEEVFVYRIDCDNSIKRRLLDIGLSKGCKVIPVLKSISGGIRAYLIRNSLIAIRDSDCEKILVKRYE